MIRKHEIHKTGYDAMSLMVPYAIAFTILWLIIILAFYIIGIPIGIGTGVML